MTRPRGFDPADNFTKTNRPDYFEDASAAISHAIHLIQNDDQLARREESAYRTEALLQNLLSTYPGILAREQIDQSTPRRRLLINQEMGIPNDGSSGDRGKLDHPFLDQDDH